MSDQHPEPESAGDIRAAKLRQQGFPDLNLEDAEPDRPTLPPLHPTHPLYPLAAWVMHHAAEQDEASRRGLYAALARAWPGPRGRTKTRYQRYLPVLALRQSGISMERIARKFCLSVKDLEDLVRDAPTYAAYRMRTPRLHATPVGRSGLPEPFDPATPEGLDWSVRSVASPDPNWRLADELAQEEGFDSVVELLIGRGGDASGGVT